MENKILYLISTTKNRTYMMASFDTKTLITFEKPVDIKQSTGNNEIHYTTIQIRRM